MRIAVIGAGMAGAACADGLLRAGFDVVVFDKSGAVGGRMATRRSQRNNADGSAEPLAFDHGAPHFSASRPRFRALLRRAEAIGRAAPWRERVYAPFPSPRIHERWVPLPDMPALCSHLLSDVTLRLRSSVMRLHRTGVGWQLALADGGVTGPFDRVIVATPAAQAALLLAGHADAWAGALADVAMAPCWTLMAVTDDVDWPWDSAELHDGPLERIARNDRKPGRCAAPGSVHWVAHATPAWSAAHLEDDPVDVCDALSAALTRALPSRSPLAWHHRSVHRWRYAWPEQPVPGAVDCLWNADLGLGVCGDAFGDGTVQAAWCSGDELADTIAAGLDGEPESPALESVAQAVH